MADIVPAHAVEFSHETDATSVYERLTATHRDTAVRLGHVPERRLLVGERAYECTVTLNQYYGRDLEASSA